MHEFISTPLLVQTLPITLGGKGIILLGVYLWYLLMDLSFVVWLGL